MKIWIAIALIFGLSHLHGIAQNQEEHVDGNTVSSNHYYFSKSIKKKQSATIDYISFYQKTISGIRGKHCPMYPSCSNYGLKTFSERNFASAFILTSDRLLRCGHDHNNYRLTLRRNGFRFVDYPHYDEAPKELYYTRNVYYFAHSDTTKDSGTLVFIKKLINKEYYHEALLEIVRTEYQSDAFDLELFINKIICLKALEEYEKALFEYETKCPEAHKNNDELLYQIALINYKLDNFQQAFYQDSLAISNSNNIFIKPRLISLKGLIHANQYNWEGAKAAFDSLQFYKNYKRTSTINLNVLEQHIPLKRKSPTTAGLLSIIPGAGYAYAGHKQTALTAFLVNGLLAYATYANIENENYGMAALTGIFNLSFYIGNIQGATKSASRYNRQQKQNVINKLEYNTFL